MKRLAIITSHPIQYYAPVFRILQKRNKIHLKVFYTWSQAITSAKDLKFNRTIRWDIPLLYGYDYEVVDNISKKPGTHHRRGLINPQLINSIRNFSPDALLVIGWNFISHFQVMKYFKGKIPVIFRGDSTLLNEGKNIKTLFRRLYLKFVYKFIDIALYVGTENKKYFIKHGLNEKQLIFAPHAIDNRRFADDSKKQYEEKAHAWRRKLGLNNDDIVILFSGKFQPEKNPKILVKAFSKISSIFSEAQYGKLKLLMAGSGILEKDLKELSRGNSNIKILPFQNQTKMPILYRIADIFCLPSNSETWGVAVNEAMASSLPVLLSDKVGCAVDLVMDGENGWIFRSNDINDLLEKFSLCVANKVRLKKMGEKGRYYIQERSFEKICFAIEGAVE